MALPREPAEEVKNARSWLLLIAAANLFLGLRAIYFSDAGAAMSLDEKLVATAITAVIPIALVGLWAYSRSRPRPAFVVALVIYASLEVLQLVATPTLSLGAEPVRVFMKVSVWVIVTVALVRGIIAAGRLHRAPQNLDRVFE